MNGFQGTVTVSADCSLLKKIGPWLTTQKMCCRLRPRTWNNLFVTVAGVCTILLLLTMCWYFAPSPDLQSGSQPESVLLWRFLHAIFNSLTTAGRCWTHAHLLGQHNCAYFELLLLLYYFSGHASFLFGWLAIFFLLEKVPALCPGSWGDGGSPVLELFYIVPCVAIGAGILSLLNVSITFYSTLLLGFALGASLMSLHAWLCMPLKRL